jgi:recombinational DNA repair protein RecT
MARKTAVRALAKYLPLSPELSSAVTRDEYRDAGIMDIDIVNTESVDPETGEITSRANLLTEGK